MPAEGMAYPEAVRIELPILQELEAAGGSDHLRYLYDRLVRYFPQLTVEDLEDRTESGRSRWRNLVQRAGRQLEEKGEIDRVRSVWSLKPAGRRRIDQEAMRVSPQAAPPETLRELSHKQVQQMLVEIGGLLGRFAEAEFEYYDVVWRDSRASPRLSHVFEVQVSGSVDSALTRLKHAYDAQRSRPFLVVADESAGRFAARRLSGSFHEIWQAITVIGTGEVERLYKSLKSQQDLLEKLTAKD